MDFLPVINLIGFAVLGVATWYTNFRSGKDKIGGEVLSLYKEQIAALEADVQRTRERSHELGNAVQKISLELGIVKGQLQEKDKKLEEYSAIFQNRNPELQQVLGEIRDFMKMIHAQGTRFETRNTAIDKASTTDTGHLLRKK